VAQKLSGKKILITGASGLVGRAVAESLVQRNEVWCLGRFTDPSVESWLRDRGIRTSHWDMARDSLDRYPDDFTHIMHAAVDRGTGDDFEDALTINSVAAGRLMTHCRRAEAFLYLSTGAVYAPSQPSHLHTEADPLEAKSAWLPTYPVSKLATEGAVRGFAMTLDLPTTIARLNVVYGPYGHGGIPVIFFRQIDRHPPRGTALLLAGPHPRPGATGAGHVDRRAMPGDRCELGWRRTGRHPEPHEPRIPPDRHPRRFCAQRCHSRDRRVRPYVPRRIGRKLQGRMASSAACRAAAISRWCPVSSAPGARDGPNSSSSAFRVPR